MWSALNEYNYSDNEVYTISILENTIDNSFRSLEIIAIIKNDGTDVDWVAFYADRK